MSIDTLEATRARWIACQSRLADIEMRLGDITGVCTDAFTNCDQIESMLANRKLSNSTLEKDERRRAALGDIRSAFDDHEDRETEDDALGLYRHEAIGTVLAYIDGLEADARRVDWIEERRANGSLLLVVLPVRRLAMNALNLRAAIDAAMKGSNATS